MPNLNQQKKIALIERKRLLSLIEKCNDDENSGGVRNSREQMAML